jgi:hypothetical protein
MPVTAVALAAFSISVVKSFVNEGQMIYEPPRYAVASPVHSVKMHHVDSC